MSTHVRMDRDNVAQLVYYDGGYYWDRRDMKANKSFVSATYATEREARTAMVAGTIEWER